MSSKKLCVNCKHCGGHPLEPICLAPQNMKPSLVDGQSAPKQLTFCSSHRTGPLVEWLACRINGYCGAEGRWFEPK